MKKTNKERGEKNTMQVTFVPARHFETRGCFHKQLDPINTAIYHSTPMSAFNLLFRPFCRVLVGALLFTQAAFATQPCVEPGMSAAHAIVSQNDDDCCDTTASSISLCVAKCADTDKLSAHTPLVVPPPTGVILTLPPLPDNALAVTALYCPGNPARDPPKTIRFCSFLI